jgi:hypothetical protein
MRTGAALQIKIGHMKNLIGAGVDVRCQQPEGQIAFSIWLLFEYQQA